MFPSENPNDQSDNQLPEKNPVQEAPEDDIILAEIVHSATESSVVAADDPSDIQNETNQSFLDVPPRAVAVAPVPIVFNQSKLQRKGGAIGGAILGTLSVLGAFLTGYSFINGLIGLLLSLWGLNSNAQRVATVGAVLSLIGIILSIALSNSR